MITISLTDFVDFINTSGTTKIAKVREIAERGDYHPCKDYYKAVREILIENRRAASSADSLHELIGGPAADSKAENYAAVVSGFQRFCKKRRRLDWFEPAEGEWMHDRLHIRVNPELGLRIEGVPHTIKLHFKDTELTPRHASVINHVMHRSLADGNLMQFGVLDTRRGRLLTTRSRSNVDALLKGEAAAFVTMYEECKAA